MKSFNLLPWREEQKRQRDRLMLVAGAIIWIGCVSLVMAARFGVTLQTNYQQQRNDFLTRHIAMLDQQLSRIAELGEEREYLIQRIEIIQDLQRERVLFGNLLQELTRQMPEGVHLDVLDKKAQLVRLEGVALSNSRVSDLMTRLNESPWFDAPKLQSIESQPNPSGGDDRSKFSLEVQAGESAEENDA